MNILPRPATRSMSVSWVVKLEGNGKGPVEQFARIAPIQEAFRAVQVVRGMWAAGDHATARYMVALRNARRGEKRW